MDKYAYIANYEVLSVLYRFLENIIKVSGVHGGYSYEIKPDYNKTDAETVIQGRTNSFIVLGRDRNAGVSSGNGGLGVSGASSIDLIAGVGGPRPVDFIFGEKVFNDKDFKNDSSRIYISQMSKNIDEYFEIRSVNLALGTKTIKLEDNTNLAAIAIKSDAVRLIARENIKIVTSHGVANSQNKKNFNGGIDIIAGHNKFTTDKTLSLQPMVKGNNLIELLKLMVDRIEDVQSTVSTFMNRQKVINDALANHVHQTKSFGTTTTEPVSSSIGMANYQLLSKTLPDIVRNFTTTALLKNGAHFSTFNEKCITSLWNRVN